MRAACFCNDEIQTWMLIVLARRALTMWYVDKQGWADLTERIMRQDWCAEGVLTNFFIRNKLNSLRHIISRLQLHPSVISSCQLC